MKNRFTFLLLTIISTAFSQQKIDTIPFQTNSKLLVFKGKINGYETNFAFDTGASVGVLNNNQANNAKVNSKKEKKVKDSNQKSAAIKITTVNEITIGSFTIENTKNGIFEMPYLGCNDFFLLGGNVINELNWKPNPNLQFLLISSYNSILNNQINSTVINSINQQQNIKQDLSERMIQFTATKVINSDSYFQIQFLQNLL